MKRFFQKRKTSWTISWLYIILASWKEGGARYMAKILLFHWNNFTRKLSDMIIEKVIFFFQRLLIKKSFLTLLYLRISQNHTYELSESIIWSCLYRSPAEFTRWSLICFLDRIRCAVIEVSFDVIFTCVSNLSIFCYDGYSDAIFDLLFVIFQVKWIFQYLYFLKLFFLLFLSLLFDRSVVIPSLHHLKNY